MKDYNEMAKAVFERRDEYLAEKKRKRAMLLKAGVPVCSLLLVSLLGVTIWMTKTLSHLASKWNTFFKIYSNKNY